MRQDGRKLLQRVPRYEGRRDKKLFTNAVPGARPFFSAARASPGRAVPDRGGCKLAISMEGLGEATVKDASPPQRQKCSAPRRAVFTMEEVGQPTR